jgi:hypothetical protein
MLGKKYGLAVSEAMYDLLNEWLLCVCLGAVGMFGIKTIGSFKYDEQVIKTVLPTASHWS